MTHGDLSWGAVKDTHIGHTHESSIKNTLSVQFSRTGFVYDPISFETSKGLLSAATLGFEKGEEALFALLLSTGRKKPSERVPDAIFISHAML